ncbi:hypothetical protein FHS15_000394 [Paenibacillus castaneae]|uniref:hypothetical protein n=1 Tax=Paenibacillus castaneae TaxID=474957 RepID=UPI0011AEE522|nr:hypothetical protein [Paenibacillus castaneae]NIK75296.1 hypothetical protein [Paenibacillus castaneae]
MIISMRSAMKISPNLLWSNLSSTSTFQKVSSPLMRFKYAGHTAFPTHWSEGETYKLNMFLFGFIPLGEHSISFNKD